MFSRNFNGESNHINLVIAALNSTATAEPKVLTDVCSSISRALFGEKIVLNSPDQTSSMDTYQVINTLQTIFSKASIAPAYAIRIQKTFYKLGIPFGTSIYGILEPFRSVNLKKVADAEKIFASYGWLDPIDHWQPFATILAVSSPDNGKLTFTSKESFLLPEAINFMSTSFQESDLITFLEKRQPQTFGALITAASIAEGPERSRLTSLAFSTNAAKLASMTPERIAEFSLLLPWLPKDAIAALPPAFRKKAEGANTDRLAKLSETADAFLKNNQRNNNSYRNDPFNEVEDLVSEIAPLDLPKATAVFLEAERRYTESLSRGGRLSSYSTGGLEVTQRDNAFEDLITGSGSPMREPALALAFHNAITSSPEASRFSFSTNSNNTPVLFKIGYNIYASAAKGSKPKEQQWMRALKNVQKLPESVQTDAYLAIGTYLIGRTAVPVLRNHATPDEIKALPESARVMHTIVVGVRNWKSDNPAQKEATRNALISFVIDSKIPFPTRFQFISMAVTLGSPILADSKIAEVYTSMFEEYAKGERSVVNSVGIHSAVVIRLAPEPDKIKPLLSRINRAFWDNANTPKPGGHPTIPQNFGDELLVSAAIVGDEVNTKKLLALAKTSLLGNMSAIHSLIANGNHEIAKQLLAPANRIYPTATNIPLYTKSFEQRFKEFSNTPGVDAAALLRIESMFVDASPSATDGNKPLESDAQREQRIIDYYLVNKPTDIMHRTEIVGRLIRDSHTAAIALHDEVIELSKSFDLKKALQQWHLGTGSPSDPSPRYTVAAAEAAVMRQAAFLRMLDGDASGLTDLVKAMEEQPNANSYHENGTYNAVGIYHERVCTSAMLWMPRLSISVKLRDLPQLLNPLRI
jgi:hypothetical protein